MELLFGAEAGSPKSQFHVLAPVDRSVNCVGGMFTHTVVELKFVTVTGMGLIVTVP